MIFAAFRVIENQAYQVSPYFGSESNVREWCSERNRPYHVIRPVERRIVSDDEGLSSMWMIPVGPVIEGDDDERWAAFNVAGEHAFRVSPFFETLDECQAWLDANGLVGNCRQVINWKMIEALDSIPWLA